VPNNTSGSSQIAYLCVNVHVVMYIYDSVNESKSVSILLCCKMKQPPNPSCSELWEGVSADPGKRDATLGVGGPGPSEEGNEQQLVPNSGGGKT
jgi:hypothetical protein